MTKFFLDIKNLKVVWDNINDLYLRKDETFKLEADTREIEHDVTYDGILEIGGMEYTGAWRINEMEFIDIMQFLSNDAPKMFTFQNNKYDIIGRSVISDTEFLAIIPYNGKFKALLLQIILQSGDNNNLYILRWVDYSHKNIDYDFINDLSMTNDLK